VTRKGGFQMQRSLLILRYSSVSLPGVLIKNHKNIRRSRLPKTKFELGAYLVHVSVMRKETTRIERVRYVL
jgi:hypothetical protein